MAEALSISSVNSGFFTPQEDCVFTQDWHQLLYHFLRLLQIDTNKLSKDNIKIDSATFKAPNIKAFQHVAHFLFTKLDMERSKKAFADCWPVYAKKQEAGFLRQVKEWCSEIQAVSFNTYQNRLQGTKQ